MRRVRTAVWASESDFAEVVRKGAPKVGGAGYIGGFSRAMAERAEGI